MTCRAPVGASYEGKKSMSRRTALVAVAGTLLALLGGAGAGSAEEVRVGGTGAVIGVLGRLGEAFAAKHPGERLEVVPGLGSGGGIVAVADGVLHLSVSSRALKAEESAKGLTSAPLLDTPFVFVTSHPKPQRLTRAEVVAVFDGTLKAWPDGKEIKPVLRPKADAATPFLVQHFEGMQPAMDKLRQRADVPVAATDQDNVATAEKVPNSLAGASLVQFMTESPRLRLVALDGADASVETMESGAYGLKMRLHLVSPQKVGEAARRFIAFLGSPEAARIMRESGAVGVPVAVTQ